MALEGKKINELSQLTTVTDETVLPVVYVQGQTTADTAQKITLSQVSTKVQNDLGSTLAAKQDKLTAGTGIEISDTNVITATGNNEAVFTESTLVSGDNVLIQKHINPYIITEDTVYLWHFDGSRVDDITGTVQFPKSGEFSEGEAYVDITPFTTGKSYKGADWYWINYDGHMVRVDDNTFGVNKSFTIDFWLVGTLVDYGPLTAGFTSGSNSSSKRFFLTLEPGTNGTLVKIIASSTSNLDNVVTSVDIPTSEVNLGNWVHVAFVYDSLTHTATAYFNGVNKLTCVLDWDTIDISWYTTAIKYLFVGGSIGTAYCKIDELRISKSAVWETNFEVPTEPYAEEGSTPDYFELKTSGLVKETDLTAFTGTDGTAAGTDGLVPAPATTDAGKYLKADGTWDTPAGGGTDLTTIDGYNPSFVQLLFNDKGTFRFKQMLTSYYNFKGSNYISANESLPSFTNMISLCHIEIEKRTTSDPYYYQGAGQAFISNSSHSKSFSFNIFDTATDLQKLEGYNGSSSVETDLALGSGVNRYWFKLVSNSSGDITLYYINDTSSMIPQPAIDSADWTQSISLASMFTTGETILFGYNDGDGYAPIRTKLLEGRIILDGDVFLDTQDTSTFTIIGDMLEKVYFN